MDGSTDAGCVEQESIIVLLQDNLTRKIKSCLRLLSMKTPERADVNGLLKCLNKSLELLGNK